MGRFSRARVHVLARECKSWLTTVSQVFIGARKNLQEEP